MQYSRFFYIFFAALFALSLFFYFTDEAGSGAGIFAWITGSLAAAAFVLDTLRARSLNDKAANK